jgi:hypothetical protein
MQKNYKLGEELLVSQEGLCIVVLVYVTSCKLRFTRQLSVKMKFVSEILQIFVK